MNDNTDLEALRRDVRSWLEANAPKTWREDYKNGTHEDFARLQRDWFRTLVKGGYAVPHWPEAWPGGGRSLAEQKVIYEEMARADTPRLLLSFVSTYHAASTLFECGSEEQKARYLPAILEGETWCQGFSEPNAGSDLAAIKTRGVVDGDHIVVTGAKMWTTDAQYADYQELLIRTDPASERHKGLTWLICDMKAPGIDIKPIRTMLQDEHVSMVFYDEVRVPIANVVGEIGQGWSTALAMAESRTRERPRSERTVKVLVSPVRRRAAS